MISGGDGGLASAHLNVVARWAARPSYSSASQAGAARHPPPPGGSKMSPLICHRCDVMTFGILKDTPIHRHRRHFRHCRYSRDQGATVLSRY